MIDANSVNDVMSRDEDFEKSAQLYEDGRELMAKGELAEAIARFEQSVNVFPHFKTLELLGECKLRMGDAKGALIPLAAAIGFGRNAFRAMHLLAQAFADIGETDEALRRIDRALEVNPHFKRAAEFRKSLIARKNDEPST